MQVNGINFRVENRYYIVPLVLILQILLSSLIRQLSIEGSRQNLTGKHHNHINGANSFTERRISWSSIIINYALNSGVCWIALLSRRFFAITWDRVIGPKNSHLTTPLHS